LSLLDFKAIEYKRKGNAVSDNEQLALIAKVRHKQGSVVCDKRRRVSNYLFCEDPSNQVDWFVARLPHQGSRMASSRVVSSDGCRVISGIISVDESGCPPEKPVNLQLGYVQSRHLCRGPEIYDQSQTGESTLTTFGSLSLNRGREPLGNLRRAAKTSLNDAAPVSTKGI
jgi:hypothetical protein